ncbi:MAG: hypothetical protein ACQSGP_02485, partial [Frankia sp.]
DPSGPAVRAAGAHGADHHAGRDPGLATAPNQVASMYVRALRLRTIVPTGWRRGVVAEGSLVLALFLALADLASAWVIVVLPIAVALMVKYNDVIAGLLVAPGSPDHDDRQAERTDPDRPV